MVGESLKAVSEKYGYDAIVEVGSTGIFKGTPVSEITGEVFMGSGTAK